MHERLLKIEAMKADDGLRFQSLERKNKRMRHELDVMSERFKIYEESVCAGASKPKRLKI